jgi:hypothetical protein
MRIKLFIMLASTAFAHGAAAQAQADVAYDGKWSATIVTDGGPRRVSQLVIREFSGTWYGKVGTIANAKKPCSGMKFPVTVQASNDTNLDFTVWGSAVGRECRDLTIELKLTGKNMFEGTVEPAGTIKLVRR